MKQEINKQINNLRTEIRTDYDRIGNLFYEIIKSLDEYLEYLNKSLEKDGNI